MVVGQTLGRTRLTPSKVTVAGFVLVAGAVWLLAIGAFRWAGCLIALASSFDMLDGALARAKNEASRFGAFLDSTLDRYSEAFVFFGLLLYYEQTAPGSTEVRLIYLAVIGSLLISYARARAEALGFECKVGLLERPERIVLIVFGLLTGWMWLTLWALAILTHITAIQRIYHVWRQGGATSKSAKHSLPLTGE
ncbi:MAG TPA: CDP-alcohol phosphatidyltransferase family protein [Roseiflexaceae bacterium]|nr:CDP-alcohol phosphatidyltransferase family protein [Roseiflexaceae bacterium]